MVTGIVSGIGGVLFLTLLDGGAMLNDYIPSVVVFIWMTFIAVLAIPYIIAGAGLMRLKPWARSFGMIVATFGLINIPLGTALGLYGLWVLMSPQSDAIFSPRFDR